MNGVISTGEAAERQAYQQWLEHYEERRGRTPPGADLLLLDLDSGALPLNAFWQLNMFRYMNVMRSIPEGLQEFAARRYEALRGYLASKAVSSLCFQLGQLSCTADELADIERTLRETAGRIAKRAADRTKGRRLIPRSEPH